VFDPSAILAAESGATEQNEPPRTADPPTTPAFTLPLLHELHPLCYQHGYRKDQDQVRSERSPVQVIKYLASLDLLVIAAGDLKLTFWQPNALFMTESPEPVYVASTEHPQRVLEWAPTASRIFSLATDNAILVWRVVAKSKKSCSAVCTDVLRSHKDMVQDLLLVNDETLVSCGMDSLIKIWDPASLECKSTRRGHKRGVRKLVKHSDSVFVSTGFERDMLGWDVSGLSIAPIFKLSGHTSPILCIQTIPQLGQAISLDDEGSYFKWWNMTNLVSMDDNDRCLQTFRFGNGQYPWKPNAFTLFTNGATILASGFHLKWIHRVRLKPKHYASSAIVLNTTTLTLLTTTDRDVQIWDAQKGTLLHVFRGLCRSDITHVVLDARERKFVLSTLGGDVLVFNYLNGALLKSFPRHSGQVSCMLYCKEDEVVLTASWDRSLRLYDDDSKKPLLRCIAQAHRADIKCMAYSYHLGLVATGSADGSLKIWDYVYFLLEQAYSEHSVEVNAVAFLDPHPIVLSGYENGMIVLHSVRPAAHPTRLCQFSIDAASPTASVATLNTLYDPFGGDAVAEGITSGRQLVYVGDYSGMLRCWDLYPVLRQHQIAAADESLLPHTSKSYNPRRRIERDGDGTAATVDRTTSAPIIPAPPVTSAWQAHTMAIKCVTLVESPVANPATKKQPKLLLETIDTAPSAFVLQHLGPDIPRKPTPKPRRRHVPALAASASAPTLSKPIKLRRASSLRFEKMLASAPSLDSIIGMPLTTTAVPVAGSPEKTLARFEAMIADRPLKAASQKKPESSASRQGSGNVTHVVLPAVTTTTTTSSVSSSPPKPLKALKSPAPGVKDTVDADRRILLQPLFGPYPRDHVLEVCRIFVRIDVDNSGVIETSEFVEKLSQLEGDDWRDALNTVFRDLDQDHNGMLDMPELLKAMFPRASTRVQDEMLQFARLAVASERHEKAKVRELSPKALADITALFHLFDVDNSGAIEPVELLREFKANERRFYDKHPERSIADRWQLADIVKIFQQYDANANASLELDEFIELFRDSF
ncbi:hypothetical protein SPRG_21385, partial [Saprolegnia parasitica CBS 223.65]